MAASNLIVTPPAGGGPANRTSSAATATAPVPAAAPTAKPQATKPNGDADKLLDMWQVHTLEDALTGEDEPWNWVITGLVLREAPLMVSGQPHAGKSLNWLAAAMEAVIKKKVWGHFDASCVRSVLFIETEDPKQVVRKRIRQLAKGLRIDPKRVPKGFHWVRTGPFDLVKAKPKLVALLKKYKPDLVVLSTLQGLLAGRNWKEQSEMADVNALIVELSHDYCPIVLVTHSPRDKTAKRAAGTITQEANFLTTMHFEKVAAKSGNGPTKTKVEVDSKLGMGMQFDLTLETEGDEVRRVVYGEHEPTKAEMILAAIKENRDATPEEIADEVGCSPQWVRKVLKVPETVPGSAGPDDPLAFLDSTDARSAKSGKGKGKAKRVGP